MAASIWRRATSGSASAQRTGRPIASPMRRTCSAWVTAAGPVSTYLAPACRSSVSASTATAATSRSWISDRAAAP